VHGKKGIYSEGRVYLHSFLTSTFNDSEWSTSWAGSFTLGERTPPPPFLIDQEAGRAPEPVRTSWRRENPLPLPGLETHVSLNHKPTALSKWINDNNSTEQCRHWKDNSRLVNHEMPAFTGSWSFVPVFARAQYTGQASLRSNALLVLRSA
jgi:hypothetical protein